MALIDVVRIHVVKPGEERSGAPAHRVLEHLPQSGRDFHVAFFHQRFQSTDSLFTDQWMLVVEPAQQC